MDNFFPTSRTEESIMTVVATPDLSDEVNRLTSQLETMTRNWEYAKGRLRDEELKIEGVEGYIRDQYDMTGEVSEDLKEIASILRIEMNKTVNVSVTVTFSGTATVPIGFDIDDLEGELSFSIDEGYNSDIEWDLDEDGQDWDIQEN